MALKKKRPKYPKLPNGFGSIKYLGGNRRNPYAVHPPTTQFTENGVPLTPKAIAYVDDWYKGVTILMTYKNGTLTEQALQEICQLTLNNDDISSLSQKLLASYNSLAKITNQGKTFKEIYDEFYEWKYERNSSKEYSKSTKYATSIAYKNCSILHSKVFRDITAKDLQDNLDNCPLKHSSKELILILYHQMYSYAYSINQCDRDYSANVSINIPDDDNPGVPFSKEEIDILWDHTDNEVIRGALIIIYSGFRISAYKNLEINLEDNYFRGGVKTKNGKNRIVPIHPLIVNLISPDMKLFTVTPTAYRISFAAALRDLGIEGHTPHDCRHTFSWLCDFYKVDRISKKLMLGHALGSDVTDSRYGHRTLEELTAEIRKIKHW